MGKKYKIGLKKEYFFSRIIFQRKSNTIILFFSLWEGFSDMEFAPSFHNIMFTVDE